ncbi:hypothetical protein Fmac_023064 [Flemingia macrophylla]|uniref:ATP synthase F0 subunit 8 n=1 Tax=Flemingia macrophylla TaxID=520843 RepID=A0ABD1LKL4_9FABA
MADLDRLHFSLLSLHCDTFAAFLYALVSFAWVVDYYVLWCNRILRPRIDALLSRACEAPNQLLIFNYKAVDGSQQLN